MKLGCVAKVIIISGSVSSYNDKSYYKLACVGSDGSADNIDCTQDVFNRVIKPDFKKPGTYEIDCEYSAGSSSKGRYQYLRVVGIRNEVK